MNPMLTAAIYVRRSKEEDESGVTSLSVQRDACQHTIAAHASHGWVEGQTYMDNGRSGGDADRPAYQALLADIAAGKVQVVVVHRIDRFTRSLLDFAAAVQVMEAQGVSFVSVCESVDTGTAHGRMILNVLVVFAQFERERIGERWRSVLGAKKAAGKTYCRKLYGFDNLAGEMVPNPEELAGIGAMRALRESGESLREIAHEMNRRQIVAPLGGSWSPSSVHSILSRTELAHV